MRATLMEMADWYYPGEIFHSAPQDESVNNWKNFAPFILLKIPVKNKLVAIIGS
jgi:hypothetical protein